MTDQNVQPGNYPWPAPATVPTLTWQPPAGVPHIGVMVVLHGGDWKGIGPGEPQYTAVDAADDAQRYANDGFVAIAPSYRNYKASLVDTINIVRAVRHQYGVRTPICTAGGSAGGNLALIAEEQLPDVACAVGRAPVTDINAYLGYPASQQNLYHVAWLNLTTPFFPAFSQALPSNERLLGNRQALLISASNDQVAPPAQAMEMFHHAPKPLNITETILPPGNTQFVHSQVNGAALTAANAFENTWLHTAVARWRLTHPNG